MENKTKSTKIDISYTKYNLTLFVNLDSGILLDLSYISTYLLPPLAILGYNATWISKNGQRSSSGVKDVRYYEPYTLERPFQVKLVEAKRAYST
jgi:hypothetical protein